MTRLHTERETERKETNAGLIMFTTSINSSSSASVRVEAELWEAPTDSHPARRSMLAARSKGSACGSWRWQAVGNPGSSTPSRTAVHNDPLLDSRVWGPATHCQPPPPKSMSNAREDTMRPLSNCTSVGHQEVRNISGTVSLWQL